MKRSVVENVVTHDDYKNILFKAEGMTHSANAIRSDKHQLGSYRITKTSLNCFDDKRYILDDGVTSLPYGHWRITRKEP